MDQLFNISSGPHVRGELHTRVVMRDVLNALMPVTILGIWAHGFYALLIIVLAIVSAVLTEHLFCKVVKRKTTIDDGSAVITGLLLALTLPANVPFYVPILGSVFAILVVKCLFGGLGHNIVNPALAGRSFLLISFGSIMTRYTLDGVASATPLAVLAEKGATDLLPLFLGNTSGVIGSSALGLIAGGIYLMLIGGITYEIPVSMVGSTALFLAIFGGHGLDPNYILPHLMGGGLLMAAFFMATDPVTCPSTTAGQVAYGVFTGILIGLFRVKGASADSTTYAVLLANLFGPIIDDLIIPTPYGYRIPKERKASIPKPVIILVIITLVAGLALSSVYSLTAGKIAENKLKANQAAFLQVLPGADSIQAEDALTEAVAANADAPYGSGFGNSIIKEALAGVDGSGNVTGYAVSVNSLDTYDGSLTLVVGFDTEGTITGLAFTELHDTAGMGMRCDEDAFKNQFVGANVPKFTLNKAGGSTAVEEIDSVSGASVSSGAVVNAVNAAIDFFAANVG